MTRERSGQRQRSRQMPATNGRFCESGAVTRGKGSTKMNVSGSWQYYCKPRLRKAAGTLGASERQRG